VIVPRKITGVDLPLFSPRMEARPPNDVHRDATMSNLASAPASNETRYYRIGEVSRLTALKPFVLRYWETEFPTLQPVKSPSGHRLYRQEDVDLLHGLWKEVTADPGYRELHHFHVLNVALQEMRDRMHNGAYRDEVMKEIHDEMERPGGTPLEDDKNTSPLM